jgi:hypothetical protein
MSVCVCVCVLPEKIALVAREVQLEEATDQRRDCLREPVRVCV